MKARRLVAFLDRDGTLISEPEDYQIDALHKVRLVEGVIPALIALRDAGYRLLLVSNQDGLGSDSFPQDDFQHVHDFVIDLFASQGIVFDGEFICPHFPADGCDCRKPRTGLLTRYLAENSIDLPRSCVVGDRPTDLELAENIGVRGFLLEEGRGWPAIVGDILAGSRRATASRKTRETDVTASVDLDATEPVSIDTGIGFYDHMLEQVSRHAGIGLQIRCRGDLEVDEHHTVEDVALVLGEALREALGARAGIGRYGFVLPMDEAQARVAVDLSGRPFAVFEGDLGRDRVGGLPTELVPHFFRSLADTLGAAIHVSVAGENTHHMVESSFKGLGRALRQAVSIDGGGIPSTKGVL
ncbi:MAG: bifunctional histidinol-phosphatase/imidazoleglycerol-phosphate dehydratase HisB [Chromatiales bacterium]|jgi:imidazoleglycerol-phosphate dehydratase/histidinol-phosphatase|nr:bifunctional histidinol-phosphatase/imidazoleglycerol-phosphate dehydratase HisB [Chromatiales bacterium]